METELTNLEKEFSQAIMSNNAKAVEQSEDFRVRVYGNTAVVTALTKTKGKFMGQGFSTQERATDVFVKQDGRWQCVISHLTRFTNK